MLRLKANRRTKGLGHLPIVLLGYLLTTAYFVHHGIFGTHGLIATDRLVSRSSTLEREIAVLNALRSRLQQDVAALGLEPPAADIVQSTARSTLGLVLPGDLIVVRRETANISNAGGSTRH